MPTNPHQGKLAFTVTWEVKPGHEQAAAEAVARFAPEARKEPGLDLLMVHQSASNPAHFLFYEVFTDAAAFAAHQETPHFKTIIMEQALPLLSKCDRIEYRVL